MGNRKKLKEPQPFVERPGFKTVPLTFAGETCGIAEIELSSGEVYATVIEDSVLDRWLRTDEFGSPDFSIETNNGEPVNATAFFDVAVPEENKEN